MTHREEFIELAAFKKMWHKKVAYEFSVVDKIIIKTKRARNSRNTNLCPKKC